MWTGVVMNVVNGRPSTNEGRQENEIRVYDLLDSLRISYERIDYEPAFTMEVCEEIERM